MPSGTHMSRRCERCRRPAFLFGFCDIRTGWQGWCGVCNTKWHISVAEPKVHIVLSLWAVAHRVSFMAGERLCHVSPLLLREVVSFMAGDVRSVQRRAWARFWDQALPSPASLAIRENGIVRETDTDDEDSDGMLQPTLDLINPFWSLKLTRCHNNITRNNKITVGMNNITRNVFDVVVGFLGPPKF